VHAGKPGTPALPNMVQPVFGWATLLLHSAGILAMTGGLHRSQPMLVQIGAGLFCAAVLATVSHHLRLLLVGR
jgi:hypothetical protein